MSTPKVTTTASTQDHLEINDIRDDIVLLKNGGACSIIRTTAVNFGLLSENEQDAIIYAYAGFLNSLSFEIQILILSKKMDITSYIELIKQQAQKQTNQALKAQIIKYEQFIGSIIQENKVLDKEFLIIVPFSPLELGMKGGTTTIMGGGKKSKKLNYSQQQLFEKAKTALTPRQDNIIRLLTRMGLKATPLTTTELIKLFYELYNPEEAIGQKMVSTADYQSALVQPVANIPAPSTDPYGTPVVQGVPQSTPQQPAAAHPMHQNVSAPGHVMRQQQQARPQRQSPIAGKAPSEISVADVQSVLSRLQNEVTKMQGK